jgi:hypothetical protein
MSQYGAIFIKSLNTVSPFTFKVITSAVTLLGPIITFLVDVIDRRRSYLTVQLCSYVVGWEPAMSLPAIRLG